LPQKLTLLEHRKHLFWGFCEKKVSPNRFLCSPLTCFTRPAFACLSLSRFQEKSLCERKFELIKKECIPFPFSFTSLYLPPNNILNNQSARKSLKYKSKLEKKKICFQLYRKQRPSQVLS
jgi:hypothetical protein